MIHKVVISDRSFNKLYEIQDKIQNLTWEYNRIGGCGSFSFDVPKRFCTEIEFGTNFNVKIYRRNPTTDVYDLWYQGRIENKTATVEADGESLKIQGMGYQSALSDIYVDRDYSSQEISVIVKSILDNDITPNTDITYDAGDVVATTYTPDTWEVNTNGLTAIQNLADTIGSREWGVDQNRKFFFKARSSSVGFIQPMGKDVLKFITESSDKEIVNRVIVIGGDVAGSPFTRTVNDTLSQSKYGRRDKVVQNSAIVTNDVADQFGNAMLSEFNYIVRRAEITLLQETQIEATIPIPLFEPRTRATTWGEKNWGTFLWSAWVDYQVNRIRYKFDNESNLVVSIQLGQLRPNAAENIKQLAYNIDQLRQQGV